MELPLGELQTPYSLPRRKQLPFHLTHVVYDIIIHDMRIWNDPANRFTVDIFPGGSFPARCYIKWKGGMAEVDLGTWQVERAIDDQPLPAYVLEWLKSNESYVWDSWHRLHP